MCFAWCLAALVSVVVVTCLYMVRGESSQGGVMCRHISRYFAARFSFPCLVDSEASGISWLVKLCVFVTAFVSGLDSPLLSVLISPC